ncbi:hypothetical protein R1sor_001080 [Riccia sorocarpa]|uniref:Uncharacterized protein n=1 Tax=Riccia sorocarpa TaxID=122646 RepID=A0ABD3GV02_9MARC
MAACMKLGSKADGFQRRGQAWFCTTGLPSDIVIEVDQMSFHLHKFPLLSKSGKLARLVAENSDEETGACQIQLQDIPGGAEAFELAAKFCYGVKVELTSANVAALRCAAEYLEMTEEFGEGNLIAKTESFLNQVVLRSWKDSVRALQSCEYLMPEAENLGIVKRCVDSLSLKACADPSLFGWPMMEHHGTLQSPGGSVLWNGISTGARGRNARSDWWYDDIASLSLPLYEKVITAMDHKGIRPESIAGALMHFAKKALPGLHRRQNGRDSGSRAIVPLGVAPNENDQRVLLETIEGLLPMQKGVTSTRFLFGLLRTAMILNASSECKSNLERRIGMQLEQATLDDLLMPNYSYTVETLYDIECVQRILDHYILLDQTPGALSPHSLEDGQLVGSPSLTPMMMVSKLMDNYLAEVAPDVNLKPNKFQALAEALPEYARVLDDGLYRAIDIYLKAHPWLNEQERERLCRIMDCQKLSLEACTHAAQNERLPLRVVVQVLFFEQLQLRTAIASAFMVTDTVDTSRPVPRTGPLDGTAFTGGHPALRADGWANVVRENQVLKGDMDKMRTRVNDLEKECTTMRHEIEKLGKPKSSGFNTFGLVTSKLGCRSRSQVSTATSKPLGTVAEHYPLESMGSRGESVQTEPHHERPSRHRHSRHNRSMSVS